MKRSDTHAATDTQKTAHTRSSRVRARLLARLLASSRPLVTNRQARGHATAASRPSVLRAAQTRLASPPRQTRHRRLAASSSWLGLLHRLVLAAAPAEPKEVLQSVAVHSRVAISALLFSTAAHASVLPLWLALLLPQKRLASAPSSLPCALRRSARQCPATNQPGKHMYMLYGQAHIICALGHI